MEAVEEVGDEMTGEKSGAAKVQERLQKRHQARLEDVERRKEAKVSLSVTEEKPKYISSTFNRERLFIEELLSGCSGTDRAETTQKLEEATTKIQELQKFLNDSLPFLTQYDVRESQATLQKLQTSLSETRQQCLPRKKFAFSARTKVTDKPPKTPPESSNTQVDKASAPAAPEQCGFSNLSNEILTKTKEEISKHPVLLTHLTCCKVRLLGSPGTLTLKHIQDCEILCGPVASSVFVDQCTNSTLVFSCQQLRMHNTSDTQVYVHVTSKAIIEDCRGLGFAPFTWSYPSLEEDYNMSGLDRDRNTWDKVDDFKWLVSGTPSPNWKVIPEADRKNNWDP